MTLHWIVKKIVCQTYDKAAQFKKNNISLAEKLTLKLTVNTVFHSWFI